MNKYLTELFDCQVIKDINIIHHIEVTINEGWNSIEIIEKLEVTRRRRATEWIMIYKYGGEKLTQILTTVLKQCRIPPPYFKGQRLLL